MADSSRMTGPYAGYDSLGEAVEGLRRARFRVVDTFPVAGRGLAVVGEILEGTVSRSMVLLPVLTRHDNIYTPLTIEAVEYVSYAGQGDHIALVVGSPIADLQPDLVPGAVLDVLERSPAA